MIPTTLHLEFRDIDLPRMPNCLKPIGKAFFIENDQYCSTSSYHLEWNANTLTALAPIIELMHYITLMDSNMSIKGVLSDGTHHIDLKWATPESVEAA